MAISLDGNSYSTYSNKYAHTRTKFGTTRRTLTGVVDRYESGYWENRYKIQLLCTTANVTSLNTSFEKVSTSTNKLDFTDEEGTHWNNTGAGGGILNTGVYFETMGDPKPLHAGGWVAGNRFLVDIELVAVSAAN